MQGHYKDTLFEYHSISKQITDIRSCFARQIFDAQNDEPNISADVN